MQPAKLTWKVVSRVLVAHATEGPVDNGLYNRFVEDMRTQDIKAYLAGTTGSAELTSVQRKAASEVLKDRGIRTFIVTDSRIVRGIVTAASWLGVNAQSFSWNEIDSAVAAIGDILNLDPAERQSVLRTVNELRALNDAAPT
jgi:hypothetical protein